MDAAWKESLWGQFGAALDMLENAVRACPDDVWGDRARRPEFWYVVFHTLFWLDCYLTDPAEGYAPPAPFTLDEMDPRGLLPERVYAKEELLAYLARGREHARATIAGLTDERARRPAGFERLGLNVEEMLLYDLRHLHHHVGQLNMILGGLSEAAPRWVTRTARPLA